MRTTEDWAYRSASDAVAALAARELSSREMVDLAIARIEARDGAINAVVVRDFDRARVAAAEADAALAAGERRPLLGLPLTVKESIDVAGLAKTWGNPAFATARAESDALAIARLKAAGAIVLGKTNVPFMLGDWQTYNEIYGTTNNPYDLDRTPGGSSGGSAAALAAGFVSLELGSDFFGSLRSPAHCCGVFAHRPSLDVIPTRGGAPPGLPVLPGRGTFAVLGPLARSARDLSLALDVLAGPDPWTDGVAYQLSLPPSRHETRPFRVLLLDEHPLFPTSAEVRAALGDLARDLGRSRCVVSRSSPLLPDLDEIVRVFLTLRAANDFSVRPAEELRRIEIARDTLAADDDSVEAASLRGFGIGYGEFLRVDRARQILQARFREVFRTFDVIVCPVMPTPAFLHDHRDVQERVVEVGEARLPYRMQGIWCTIASLLGLPATVAPIARAPTTSLPIGAQIIGPYLEDRTTLAFAEFLERERGGFVPPP
ncbi:MAG TPA: amidase [Polyangiaceae bacterium]|jgi:amidase|nr:amidase [Polyangiaceae bacterium]